MHLALTRRRKTFSAHRREAVPARAVVENDAGIIHLLEIFALRTGIDAAHCYGGLAGILDDGGKLCVRHDVGSRDREEGGILACCWSGL